MTWSVAEPDTDGMFLVVVYRHDLTSEAASRLSLFRDV